MKLRYLLLAVIATGYLIGYLALDRWNTTLYFGDSNGYYLHVVSFFVNQDVGDYDKTITTLREISPNTQDPREDKFGIRLTEKGRRYIKYTLGVPVMETPFFLVAHAYVKLTGCCKADGWSSPYKFVVGLSIIFYVVLGFNFLILILSNYFSKQIVTISILAIAFATNLFYQSTYVVMSHGFLFFDYCLLIYLSVQFYKQPNWLKALGVGAVVGLIAITRVPEVVSGFIPLLWGVTSWRKLQERVQFFVQNWNYVLLAAIGFFALFSIQFSYWYYVSGHLVFNPYEGEGFNFLQPKIWKGFFHFQNGWLIYTPIMAFSLIGLFFLRKYFADSFLPLIVFVGLQAFIHYSYYAWSYFPGLGQRPMVETYPLLIFSLAACFTYAYKSNWSRWIPITALTFFASLNLFQTWQMNKGIVWSERGNPAFYYETFGALKPTLKSLIAFDVKEIQPDSNRLSFMGNLATQAFEDSTSTAFSSNIKRSGKFSFLTGEEDFTILKDNISMENVQPGDWVSVKVDAYMDPKDQIWQRYRCLLFGIQFLDNQGKKQKEKTIKPSAHIGNHDYSIWTAGKGGQWGEVTYYTKVPRKFKPDWKARVFVFNGHRQKLYLDDIRIDHFQEH